MPNHVASLACTVLVTEALIAARIALKTPYAHVPRNGRKFTFLEPKPGFSDLGREALAVSRLYADTTCRDMETCATAREA